MNLRDCSVTLACGSRMETSNEKKDFSFAIECSCDGVAGYPEYSSPYNRGNEHDFLGMLATEAAFEWNTEGVATVGKRFSQKMERKASEDTS